MMKLANKLAKKISSELNCDKEKCAVISYGIFAFLQTLVTISIIAFFGLLLGVVFQSLVVSFAGSILRKYSGGVHATRPGICLIVGTVVIISITMITHGLIRLIPLGYVIGFAVIILVSSYYLILKYAPVDSPSKPIKTERKRKRMKKASLIVLSLYIVCICLLYVAYFVDGNVLCIEYAMGICMATGWQVLTLTQRGHRFLTKIDSIITKVLFFKKGVIS